MLFESYFVKVRYECELRFMDLHHYTNTINQRKMEKRRWLVFSAVESKSTQLVNLTVSPED